VRLVFSFIALVIDDMPQRDCGYSIIHDRNDLPSGPVVETSGVDGRVDDAGFTGCRLSRVDRAVRSLVRSTGICLDGPCDQRAVLLRDPPRGRTSPTLRPLPATRAGPADRNGVVHCRDQGRDSGYRRAHAGGWRDPPLSSPHGISRSGGPRSSRRCLAEGSCAAGRPHRLTSSQGVGARGTVSSSPRRGASGRALP
jgi:hypothetical protein